MRQSRQSHTLMVTEGKTGEADGEPPTEKGGAAVTLERRPAPKARPPLVVSPSRPFDCYEQDS